MRPTLARLIQAVPDAEIPEWLRINRPGIRDRRLTYVTSPKLCDDVLHVLEKSLPRPHTCDILDLNPGPCLWSRKLHELLKPRRHVLIEPRYELFKPFIQPLLEQHDSPYRLASDLTMALHPKGKFLSEDVYNFRDHLSKTGQSKMALNKNLLLTVNLSDSHRRARGFSGTIAKQFFNDYYGGLYIEDDYTHRYGLVRLLAWTGEDARPAVMPTSVQTRTKQSIQLETVCRVENVAGPSQFWDLHPHQMRWFELDAENQTDVRKRQTQEGIPVPPGRDQPDPSPPMASLQPDIEQVRKQRKLYPHHRTYIEKLLKLDEKLAADEPEKYAEYYAEAERGFRKGKRRTRATPEMRTYRIMLTELRVHYNTFSKVRDLIREARKLFHRFRTAWERSWRPTDKDPPRANREAEATKLVEEDESMRQHLQQVPVAKRTTIVKALDDYRCYDADPKVMSWNRRRYEPLLAQHDEFSPANQPMYLFDVTPIPHILDRLDSLEKRICFDYVCSQFMMNPCDSVVKAIKKIVPAGYDQFLEGVPELKNVSLGGLVNLDHVAIRTVHHDVLVAIALAFRKWPRRPPIEKLMSSHQGVFTRKIR